ncbi:MAG TPA: endonuclease/exonuclease/phosphatase family protein [Terriglobales bacterium]|nr:endonuclease/exonuclease/phosphatase family protein [Terriglobales bacterium]
MPYYAKLWAEKDKGIRVRTAESLLRLRKQLGEEIPLRADGKLLLATWNIREFDSGKFGERCAECFYYIAEIISRFDLVAVQEVNEDLRALRKVQGILGGWWNYLVTDVTAGSSGNRERLAFLYDSRKVKFSGLAGELVLPEAKNLKAVQFARTPFVCGFQAGWTKFNLCTVHIYYGTAKKDDPRRVKEINDVAEFLEKRAKSYGSQPLHPGESEKGEPENLVLLGDFNIFSPEDVTMQAILKHGFQVPEEIQTLEGTSADRKKHYDQIAFITRKHRFQSAGHAGVFDYYKSVFRDEDEDEYKKSLMGDYKQYKAWRTHQMSDHLPMWVQLQTDFAREYLEELAKGEARGAVV